MDVGEHAEWVSRRHRRLAGESHDTSPKRAPSAPPTVALLRHLQRTAGNQAVNHLLRKHAAGVPSSALVQRDTKPAAGNPVMHAAFQASIVLPIHEAGVEIKQRKPEPARAIENLLTAARTARALVPPLRAQGSEVAAERTTALVLAVATLIEELNPHVGVTKTLPFVADDIDGVEPRIARVEAELIAATPIPGAAQTEGNPEMHATFQAAIATPIRQAKADIRQRKPEPKRAIEHLRTAGNATTAFISPLRAQGSELAAAGTTALLMAVAALIEELNPHAGIKRTLPRIASDLDAIETSLASIDAAVSTTVPTPAPIGP